MNSHFKNYIIDIILVSGVHMQTTCVIDEMKMKTFLKIDDDSSWGQP